MAKSYEMYVFDWDGTLMDTTRLIMKGYQHASKALGYPVPSDELVLSTIGLNRSDSIALCCCDCPKGRYAEFIQAYMDWYAKKEAELELVPGFRQLLENMYKDGKRLAIAHLFECVQTADTNFSKPNPGMLLAIADESGLETKNMVMVGDAVLDMQMAANAGADSVAVSYGASPRERLLETASLGVADNVPQLAANLGLEKYLD